MITPTPYQIAIIGPSGRGKTMSFRNLDPDKTGFINIEAKPLPFLNKFKHYCAPSGWQEAYNKLIEYGKNPEIEVVVLESFSAYIESVLKTMRETKKGFDIWSAYNDEIGRLLYMIKKYPKHIFITAHTNSVINDDGASERRIAVKGNEWSNVGVEREFTIVNLAGIRNIEGKKEYVLYLNSDGRDTSKTPPFIVEKLGGVEFIPNDANILLKGIEEAQKQ